MIYAIYRPLYGEDFIKESILSIIDHVNKVFFCYTDVALAGVTDIVYKGEPYQFNLDRNDTADESLTIVKTLKERYPDKIVIMKQDGSDNMNQFTRIMNDMILPKYEKPDIAFLIEPDQVFREDQIVNAIEEFKASDYRCASTKQIELWKTPDWRIPYRKRTGVVFWKCYESIPNTLRQAEPRDFEMPYLNSYVHNFGFCMSPHNMFLKHLLSLAFSKAIGDSQPNEDWFDMKWLWWHPITNNVNLEISKGYEYMIPYAHPYDTNKLPELIKDKYGY